MSHSYFSITFNYDCSDWNVFVAFSFAVNSATVLYTPENTSSYRRVYRYLSPYSQWYWAPIDRIDDNRRIDYYTRYASYSPSIDTFRRHHSDPYSRLPMRIAHISSRWDVLRFYKRNDKGSKSSTRRAGNSSGAKKTTKGVRQARRR